MTQTNVNTKKLKPANAPITSAAVAEQIRAADAEYTTAKKLNFDGDLDDEALADIRARRAALVDRLDVAREREAAGRAKLTDAAREASEKRLEELLGKRGLEGWRRRVEGELVAKTVESAKALLEITKTIDREAREARADLFEIRALARELGVAEPSVGRWEPDAIVNRVSRRVSAALHADGVDQLDADRRGELVERR